MADASTLLKELASKIESQGAGILTNERLKDRVLWIVLAAIPLLVIMHRYGFDAIILDRVFDLVIFAGIVFGVRGMVRDIMNGLIHISKNNALAIAGKLTPENAEDSLEDDDKKTSSNTPT